MAIRISTGLRNAMLGTGGPGLVGALQNGFIDIYSGAQPTTANSVEAGAKLCRITSTSGTGVADGLKFGTAASGVIEKDSTAWSGVCSADGVAGWFRFYGSGGTAGTSTTEIRMDGSVGVTGADLNLSHTTLATSATVLVKTFTITQPAE